MLHLQLIRTVALGVLLLATFPAAAQSNAVDSVPLAAQDLATQEEISQVCLPVQFREGAGAYRNCVQAELAVRSGGKTTDLGNLTFDDKYAVQQACAKAGGQSSQNYQSCVTNQINELRKIATPDLAALSEDERYVVQQSCFDAQSKQGAAIYRQCLNNEVQSLLSIPAADTSKLDMLKKNALQLRCSSNSSNAVQYRQCIADQYESISGIEPEFLPAFSAAKTSRPIEPANLAANTASAPSVNDTVANVTEQNANSLMVASENEATQIAEQTAVAEQPVVSEQPVAAQLANPDTGADAAEPAMALPRNIAPPTNATALAQSPTTEPVDDQIGNAAAQTTESPTAMGTSVQPEPTDAAITTDTNAPLELAAADPEARVISRPELVETLELQTRAKAQGIDLEAGADSTSATAATTTEAVKPMQQLSDLWQKFLNSLSSMDAIGWLLIAGVLALPALLLGLFSMIRGLKRSKPDMQEHAAVHSRRQPEIDSRRMRHEQDAATLFDDEVHSEHDAVTRIATKSEQAMAAQRSRQSNRRAPHHQSSAYAEQDQFTGQPQQHGYQWQSAFGRWLGNQPNTNTMESCIEFIIYWIAYGDDRYQPDLKKRLFSASDLSTNDEIKRWVLKQDIFAFSDVVGWLRSNATQTQLDQCISLIMALLVTEHGVTPVQNTLLRFLADAFNIGKAQIEQRFAKAFDHPMPPVPRPDKYAWWAKQRPEITQRWEARSMATRPEAEQMIARLGLTAEYDEAQVINAFRRAARRCHPDRFSELGQRERVLAEQQFIKFEQARDKLLGVSV